MSEFIMEYQEIRKELREIKVCQRQYFFISITGAGILLGVSRAFDVNEAGYILLSPLVIILPCWIMFFDKATSVTRMTGYLRILEDIIGDTSNTNYKFIGYENAVAMFRDKENNGEFEHFNTGRGRMFSTPWGTRYRYWKINWYTYWLLSVLCFGIAIAWNSFHGGFVEIWFLAFVSAGCIIFVWVITSRTLGHINNGKYSYENFTNSWKTFLPVVLPPKNQN